MIVLDKKIKCPWCEEAVKSKIEKIYDSLLQIIIAERRCPHCANLLSSYSVEEGNFLEGIRVFFNNAK